MSDELTPDQIPSTERGPRQPDQHEWTGTGTPRSSDTGQDPESVIGDRDATVDPAIAVGATTSSHPADAEEVAINRSGSGGSGGAATEDDLRDEGSTPGSMSELLSGESDES